MKINRRATFIVTCPECSRKYLKKEEDFMKRDEVCCPYCGVCFKTGNSLTEEIQKCQDSFMYHY